jgi:hypothetical protein
MSSMRCGHFERWLDSGMPVEGAVEARVHAAACAGCAARESAARELEVLLAVDPPAAPSGFTATVMTRIAARRRLPLLLPANPLPWWVRAAADPACALALVSAALFVWGLDRMPVLVGAIGAWERALVASLGSRAPQLLDAGTWSAVAVSLVPTVILASLTLYRWSLRRVQAAALAGVRLW